MALDTSAIGRTYDPVIYAAGREKIREYARAVGETDPRHLDVEAARAAGYADVVAPPMFAAVYCGPAIGPVLFDPALGIEFARLVHGSQEFVWDEPVVAGDELATAVTVADITEKLGNAFYVLASTTTNQHGRIVSRGTWTNIVRGA